MHAFLKITFHVGILTIHLFCPRYQNFIESMTNLQERNFVFIAKILAIRIYCLSDNLNKNNLISGNFLQDNIVLVFNQKYSNSFCVQLYTFLGMLTLCLNVIQICN